MMFPITSAGWGIDGGGFFLKLYCDKKHGKVLDELPTKVDCELKQHRERRSLDANAYCWVLIGKLADKLNLPPVEIYREMVKEVGVYRDFHLPAAENKTLCTLWRKQGLAWLTETLDYEPDGDNVVTRCWYGSSVYNTKQMSRLIDLIVQECREQNIETMTPAELAGLLERWELEKK